MSNRTVKMPPLQRSQPAGPSAPPPAPQFPPAAAPQAPIVLRHPGRPAAHPLMDAMYWACSEVLTVIAGLGSGAVYSSAHDLRAFLEQRFAAMSARARSAGIAPEDVRESSYALMAVIDEILVQTNWPGRQEWHASLLQFRHFQENTAGENFFRRAHTLLGQPHRAHVLQIYFLCLGLGFQGRYMMVGGAGLAPFYDQIAAAVGHSVPRADVLSPQAAPPDGHGFLRPEEPIVRISLGFLVLAFVLFLGLRLVLSAQVSSATAPMLDYAHAAQGGP